MTIRRKPARRTRSRRARFTFTSPERGAKFQCRVDRGRFAACKSGVRRTVRPGRHTFRVRALDALGNPGAEKSASWRVLAPRRRR